MLKWLSEKRKRDRIARALYGSSVTAARREAFYSELRVPDTIGGRFEILVLHLFLVLDRLRDGSGAGQETARQLADVFFESLDDAMREMGVGDLTVPKRMHKAAGAFYGRLEAYAAASAAGEQALEAAIERNVYGGEGERDLVRRLAGWVLGARAALGMPGALDLERGEVVFPAIGAGKA